MHVEWSHFVPMRNGIRLSTDLHLPDGVDGPVAAILERTPYDKSTHRKAGPGLPVSFLPGALRHTGMSAQPRAAGARFLNRKTR